MNAVHEHPPKGSLGPFALLGSDGSGTSGDTVSRPLTSAEKTKARNRRAQATYRSKRKTEKGRLDVSLGQITTELQNARQERQALHISQAVYNNVLLLRNEYIGILTAAEEDTKTWFHPMDEPGLTAGQLGLLHSSCTNMDDIADKIALRGRDLAAFRSVPLEELGATWRERCDLLSRNSIRAEELQAMGQEDTAIHEDIKAGFARGRLQLWRLVRQRPGCVLEVTRAGRPLPSNAYHAERWLAVLDAMRVTPAQDAVLDSVQAVIMRRLDRVMEDRRMLLQQLQENVEHPNGTCIHDAASSLKLHEAMQRLQNNLADEYKITGIACQAFFSETFSELQRVIIFRESAPILPDILSIFSARAARQQAQGKLVTA